MVYKTSVSSTSSSLGRETVGMSFYQTFSWSAQLLGALVASVSAYTFSSMSDIAHDVVHDKFALIDAPVRAGKTFQLRRLLNHPS